MRALGQTLLRVTLVSLPALAVACGKDSESNSGSHSNGAHGGTNAGEAGDNGIGGSSGHGGSGTAGRGGSGGRGGNGTAAVAGDDETPGGAPGSGGTHASGGSGGSGARGGTGPRGGTGGGSSGDAGSDTGGETAGGQPGTGGTVSGTGGTDSGTGGAAGAGGPTEHGLYIGPAGSDTNSGTREHPFATLAHAAGLAQSGETITFLDGTFVTASTSQAITIKNGVDIVAENSGAVTLQSTGGALLDLLGTSHVVGLKFSGFATPIRAASANGVVTLSKFQLVTCASASTPAVEAASGVTVYLVGDGSATFSHCSSIAHASDTATVNVENGAIEYPAAASAVAFRLEDQATLDVVDLDATAGGGSFAALSGSSYAKVHDSGIRTSGAPGFVMQGDASLHFHGSELAVAPNSLIYPCVDSQMNGAGSIAILDSGVHGCSAAVSGTAPVTTELDQSEIYDMGVAGLDYSGVGGIDVTDSWFHDTAAAGLWLGSTPGGSAFQLIVRGTRVEGATAGVLLEGSDASTWDLGTLAEPGDNVLLGTTSLSVTSTGFVSAIGNTWHASAQGADTSGLYSAGPTPGAVLEVTSGSGVNYNDSGGATIRLAQNAP